jgi:site-specific recombinase XerD
MPCVNVKVSAASRINEKGDQVDHPAHLSQQPTTSSRFVNKLGVHHFAHLRAVAEGVALEESAVRYLGIEHGLEAITAHRETAALVRAIGRRRGDSAWRLIGATIYAKRSRHKDPPTLDEFMEEQDLDGFSEKEITELYVQAYPPTDQRSQNDRSRARSRTLHLLHELELVNAQKPEPHDDIAGWYDSVTASRLRASGFDTIGQLQKRIARGGKWFDGIHATGQAKAARIEAHLRMLLPDEPWELGSKFELQEQALAIVGRPAPYPVESAHGSTLEASSDAQAVIEWIESRAGSMVTKTSYEREARRLLVWLQYEKNGRRLGEMTANDCRDYMAFLQHIPAQYISRRRASPLEEGWAPFRGQLDLKSQRYAVVVISSMTAWLVNARYVTANPWALVNTKTGDDRNERMLDTKAISPGAFAEILRFVQNQADTPSKHRMIFILLFMEAVGLRSAELLSIRLKDFSREPEGWFVQVHGKGAKNRVAAVPGQAFDAMQAYLSHRGVGTIETADPELPLLASVKDVNEPIGYQALYEHVKGWLKKSITAAEIPAAERNKLSKASTHWLRHTFGTRAVAKEVPLDVIQAQMGHASIQTTMSIYGRAPIKRRAHEMEKAFGSTVKT